MHSLYNITEFCLFYPVNSTAGDVIGLLNDYLFSELPLDIENVHKGATTLCHLKRTLGTACQGLNRSACFLLLLLMMNRKWKLGAIWNVRTVMMQYTDNAAYFLLFTKYMHQTFCTKMYLNSH